MSSRAIREAARRLRVVCALFIPVVVAVPAAGQDLGLSEYGPRAGFSLDPDQVTIGGFADWGTFAPQVHFATSADLGLGDSVFTLLINGDVLYRFEGSSSVVPYAGGGLAYAFADADVQAPPGVKVDDTSHEIGINLVAGIWKDIGGYRSGSLEIRLGIDNLPDIKITAALGFF